MIVSGLNIMLAGGTPSTISSLIAEYEDLKNAAAETATLNNGDATIAKNSVWFQKDVFSYDLFNRRFEVQRATGFRQVGNVEVSNIEIDGSTVNGIASSTPVVTTQGMVKLSDITAEHEIIVIKNIDEKMVQTTAKGASVTESSSNAVSTSQVETFHTAFVGADNLFICIQM